MASWRTKVLSTAPSTPDSEPVLSPTHGRVIALLDGLADMANGKLNIPGEEALRTMLKRHALKRLLAINEPELSNVLEQLEDMIRRTRTGADV